MVGWHPHQVVPREHDVRTELEEAYCGRVYHTDSQSKYNLPYTVAGYNLGQSVFSAQC